MRVKKVGGVNIICSTIARKSTIFVQMPAVAVKVVLSAVVDFFTMLSSPGARRPDGSKFKRE